MHTWPVSRLGLKGSEVSLRSDIAAFQAAGSSVSINLLSLRLHLQVKAAPASPQTSAPAQITHQPKLPRMWLAAKVRHLVLINHSPLPSLPLYSPLFPPHLLPALPIFGERPACSGDNPKLKTKLAARLGSRKPEHFWALCLGGGDTHTHKTAYLNCGGIRLRVLLGRRGGKEVGWWRRQSFTFSSLAPSSCSHTIHHPPHPFARNLPGCV